MVPFFPVSPQFCFFLKAGYLFSTTKETSSLLMVPPHSLFSSLSLSLSHTIHSFSLPLPPFSYTHFLPPLRSFCLSLQPTFSRSPSTLTLNLSSYSLSNVLKLKLHSELEPFYSNMTVSRRPSISLQAGSRRNPSRFEGYPQRTLQREYSHPAFHLHLRTGPVFLHIPPNTPDSVILK